MRVARRTRRKNDRAAEPVTAPLRVVGYVRCSTTGQSESDFSTLDSQKDLIASYIERQSASSDRPWKLTEFFVDNGFSAKNTDRPELQRLLADVKAERVDVIVVYKLDRITRSIQDFGKLDALFEKHHISLASVNDQFDTTTPMGRAMRTILLVFAQLERETTAERTRDKMYAEIRLGRWQGGVIPFGYRLEGRKLVIDEKEAGTVRLIYSKYLELRSPSKVRDYINGLGLPSPSRGTGKCGRWTVQGIDYVLTNARYSGVYNWGAVAINDPSHAIIDPEEFELVQDLAVARQTPTTTSTEVKYHFLLQGLVRCPHCGYRMTPFYVKHKRPRAGRLFTPYYECQRPHKNPHYASCPIQRYNAMKLDKAVLLTVAQYLANPDSIPAVLANWDKPEGVDPRAERHDALNKAISRLSVQIDNLVDAVSTGTELMSVEARLRDLERERQLLRVEKTTLDADLHRERGPAPTREEVEGWYSELLELLATGSVEKQRELISCLIGEVEAESKKKVRVRLYNLPAQSDVTKTGSCTIPNWLPGVDSNHEPAG